MYVEELVDKNRNSLQIGTVTTNDLRYITGIGGKSFEDTTITVFWSSTFLHVSTQEEITNPRPLKSFLKELEQFSKEVIMEILSHFTDKNITIEIEESKIDIKKLTALLLWISTNYREYGEPKIDIVFDPETGKYQFLSIIIPNCDWETWKLLTKEIKTEMKKSNLENMISKVAIVCLKGLLEEKP